MVKRKIIWTGAAAGLVLILVGSVGHLMSAQGHALGAAINCSGTLTLDQSSGTFSTQTAATVLHVSASGLDQNSQVYLQIFDGGNHSANLIPVTGSSTDGTGAYGTSSSKMTIELPLGGVAGGSDTIVVADNGNACASAPFTLQPSLSLFPPGGYAFSFLGEGFPSGSTVTVSYVDSKSATNTLSSFSGVTADSLGRVGGSFASIPSGSATGQGTVQISDTQGHSASAPFVFGGTPSTPNGQYNPPAYSTANITPFPGVTFIVVPTAVPTPIGGFPTPQGSTTPVGSPVVPFPTSTPSTGGNTTPATATNTPGGFTATGSTPTLLPTAQRQPTTVVPNAFPTPTGVRSTGGHQQCQVTHTLLDGNFEQQLTCWTVSPAAAVSIDKAVRYGGTAAARLSPRAKSMAMLSQPFIYDKSTQSVVLYYQSRSKLAVAQVLGNRMILVGQRLAAASGKSFTRAVLTLPSGIKPGNTLSLMITAQDGTTYVDEIAISSSPIGALQKPALKPSPTPTHKAGTRTAATATPKPKPIATATPKPKR